MDLVVDTSVWSLFLRREGRLGDDAHVKRLRFHLEAQDCIHLLGPVLQELLDGVKVARQFDLLCVYLEPFPLVHLSRADYVAAARLRNHCRSKGIQAGPIDFLIASACINRGYPLLTADKDFEHISKHSRLVVLTG